MSNTLSHNELKHIIKYAAKIQAKKMLSRHVFKKASRYIKFAETHSGLYPNKAWARGSAGFVNGAPAIPKTTDSRYNASINNYKNLDFKQPQIILVEIPITNGNIPIANHSQLVALLPENKWIKLPATEKAKYRMTYKEYGGEKYPVYWRTVSTSPGDANSASIPNSEEGDWFMAHTLIGGRNAELRQRSLMPSKWSQATKPADITHYNLKTYTSFGGAKHEDVAASTKQLTTDNIGSMAPSNIAQIKLYDDRVDDKGGKIAVEKTINDAMNAGERISNIMANGRHYDLLNNNCHFGTVAAIALNPYLMPGKFSCGGARGFSMDSRCDPFDKYVNSSSIFNRWNVPFEVTQHLPNKPKYTRAREAALNNFEKKMENHNKRSPHPAVFPIP